MAGLKRKKGKLTTADLAKYGIAQKQTGGAKLVNSNEPKTLDTATAGSEPTPLFPESEA